MSGVTSLNEKAFVVAAARQDKRVDGRPPLSCRGVRVSLLEGDEGAEVQLGTTRCIAHVTAEVVKPHADKRCEGMLALELHPSNMADPSYESNRAPESLKSVRNALQTCLFKSKAVDTESLCIVPGKAVWAIRCEVRVLDNSGNVTDAACLAAAAALKAFKRPDVTTEGDKVTVHSLDEREPLPLTLYCIPLAVTFGVVDLPANAAEEIPAKTLLLSDPSLLEESVINGRVTVTSSSNEKPVIYGIQKSGGAAIDPGVLQQCCAMSVQRAEEMSNVVEKTISARDDKAKIGRGRKRQVLDTLWDPPPSYGAGSTTITGDVTIDGGRVIAPPPPAYKPPKEVLSAKRGDDDDDDDDVEMGGSDVQEDKKPQAAAAAAAAAAAPSKTQTQTGAGGGGGGGKLGGGGKGAGSDDDDDDDDMDLSMAIKKKPKKKR